MDRITVKHLRGLCNTLNKITGNPLEAYGRDATGKFKANIGAHYIDGAYGGWELHQICTEGGGVNCPLSTGHCSARELYNAMHAYLRGLEDGRKK